MISHQTQYNSGKRVFKIQDVDKKIPNSSGPVKKTDCNTKIRQIENMISSVTGSVNTTSLNTKSKIHRDLKQNT